MAALRNLTSWLSGIGRERVSVDDGDSVEPVSQHSGSAKPRHAGADHDGVFAGAAGDGYCRSWLGCHEDRVEGVAGRVVNGDVDEADVSEQLASTLVAPGGSESGAAVGE